MKWEFSFGVWLGNKIVGYAIVSLKSENHAHLHHFMVHKDYRNNKIGHLMLNELFSVVNLYGCEIITLKVNSENNNAKRFYKKAGFKMSQLAADYSFMEIRVKKIIGIHQPNYLPWLGYFNKIVRSDIFVFLDDVQFTKGGYINRVKIVSPIGSRWLTVPVKVSLGDNINKVKPVDYKWVSGHKDLLYNTYKKASAFNDVWSDIKEIYDSIPSGSKNLAKINMEIIKRIAKKLNIKTRFVLSSDMDVKGKSDDRLIEIITELASNATYLSGKGGDKYQDPEKFKNAGITLEYLNFKHPVYPQANETNIPGLSVLDAVFNLGWNEVSNLIKNNGRHK